MPTCKHCHQPQTAALVICSECYRALTERTDSMDIKKLIEALLSCVGRMDCRKCPIFGRCNGTFDSAIHVAVEYIKAQATENATIRAQLEEMTQRNDENSGACKIFARRLAEKDKQLAAADICDGCNYKNTVGCHCARAKWRGPHEAGEGEG